MEAFLQLTAVRTPDIVHKELCCLLKGRRGCCFINKACLDGDFQYSIVEIKQTESANSWIICDKDLKSTKSPGV